MEHWDEEDVIHSRKRIEERNERKQEWTPPRVRGDERAERGQRAKRDQDEFETVMINQARSAILAAVSDIPFFQWSVNVGRKPSFNGLAIDVDEPEERDFKSGKTKASFERIWKVIIGIQGFLRIREVIHFQNKILFDYETGTPTTTDTNWWSGSQFNPKEERKDEFDEGWEKTKRREGTLFSWETKKGLVCDTKSVILNEDELKATLIEFEETETRSNKRRDRK